ncbi:hypothetical protein F5Y17DRAFT_228849 [Xylariaceae sp. FL0594]|nr:hypothetical protein F5Y17DRAFT_228849 [Xylariaceae sp. FL0594]
MSGQPTNSTLSPDGTGSGKRSSIFSSFKRALSKKDSKDRRVDTGLGHDVVNDVDGHAVHSKAREANLDDTNPFADPAPPAYSETSTAPESSGMGAFSGHKAPFYDSPITPTVPTIQTTPAPNDSNDKLAFLSMFDTAFLIDDSGSMAITDYGATMSRWDQTRDVIKQIIPVCMRYDKDGVDLYFLNDPEDMFFEPHDGQSSWSKQAILTEGKASHVYHNVTDPKAVCKIFKGRTPSRLTPTGKRLDQILSAYIGCYVATTGRGEAPPKPLNIIVITDGDATDRPFLVDSLLRHARHLDQIAAPYHQVGVQFFQVGKDRSAADFLRQLDDDLTARRKGSGPEIRDMVDCVTFDELSKSGHDILSADTVLKVVLGSVNKSLDAQRIRSGKLSDSGTRGL